METKICTKCTKELPLDRYSKNKNNNDGLSYTCKDCDSERKKQHYENNKEKVLEHKKWFREENKEKIKNYNKQYNLENKESRAIQRKKYYEENKERILEYKNKHRSESKEWRSKYRKTNREKYNTYRQGRKALKLKLPSTLTVRQWKTVKLDFNNQCCYCGQVKPLAQEHFIALIKGGEYTHNNIIPACRNCNSSKGDLSFFEWYPKYKYYDKERESFILDFLGYSNEKQQLKLSI